jgi:hypothetical protein
VQQVTKLELFINMKTARSLGLTVSLSLPGGADELMESKMVNVALPKDGVIGRPSLWIAEDFWVLRFRLMVKRGPW